MALSSSPDCLFRPEDQALRILFPSIEDAPASTFDDYMNGDIYDLSEQNDNKNLSDALTEYLGRKPSLQSNGRLSPIIGPSRVENHSPQPWRKGLWCLNQNVPEIEIAKTRNNDLQTHPGLQRPYEDDGSSTFFDPRSPPETVSPPGKGTFPIHTRTAKYNESARARRGIERELTLSPTPMYAQMQHNQRMAQHDTWQDDFQNFNLRPTCEDVPAMYPSSNMMPQRQRHIDQLNGEIVAQNFAAERHQHHLITCPNGNFPPTTAQNYSIVDPNLMKCTSFANGELSQSQEHPLPSQYPPPQRLQELQTWTTESFPPSSESQTPYEEYAEPGNSAQAQKWYAPTLRATDTAQQLYPPQYCYPLMAAPTPQRPTHQLLQPHHSSPTTQGLGIRYKSSYSPLPPLPPLQPASSYAFTNDDPFSSPKQSRRQRQRHRSRRKSSPTRSPSPSISPTTTRSLRQRSPTHHPHTSPTHARRKSIHRSGIPINNNNNKSPNPSTIPPLPPLPRTPRTPKTPRTPTATTSTVAMDFVNFTPKDSAKLLSDVAPSGSSKTRARRELEAREKRRRLSEAAIKAIRRAGGDVRVLKAEGLCLT